MVWGRGVELGNGGKQTMEHLERKSAHVGRERIGGQKRVGQAADNGRNMSAHNKPDHAKVLSHLHTNMSTLLEKQKKKKENKENSAERKHTCLEKQKQISSVIPPSGPVQPIQLAGVCRS